MTPTSPSAETPLDPRIARTRKDVLSAALRVLIDDGSEAVTHANLAKAAGYSKATLYTHWPTRADFLRDALEQVGEVEHHRPTGDLRADLVAEVSVYRREMEHHRLDRALVVLVGLVETMPELVPVRDKLVEDGEQLLRALLETHLKGDDLEAATLMLVGAVLQSALLHGEYPSDAVIGASVDMVMRTFDLGAAAPAGATKTPTQRRRQG